MKLSCNPRRKFERRGAFLRNSLLPADHYRRLFSFALASKTVNRNRDRSLIMDVEKIRHPIRHNEYAEESNVG